jgi:hypothetical protein
MVKKIRRERLFYNRRAELHRRKRLWHDNPRLPGVFIGVRIRLFLVVNPPTMVLLPPQLIGRLHRCLHAVGHVIYDRLLLFDRDPTRGVLALGRLLVVNLLCGVLSAVNAPTRLHQLVHRIACYFDLRHFLFFSLKPLHSGSGSLGEYPVEVLPVSTLALRRFPIARMRRAAM